MIGKGFVLFKINSSPSAFYIIKPTCISWLVFKVSNYFKKLSKSSNPKVCLRCQVMTSAQGGIKTCSLFVLENGVKDDRQRFLWKWVKSTFEQFITMQTRVGSTNGWIISQNAEILKFYFSTISGNLRNLSRHSMAAITLDVPLVSSFSAFIQ